MARARSTAAPSPDTRGSVRPLSPASAFGLRGPSAVTASRCRQPARAPMPKLTDTQLMLLSKATQQDGIVLIPANLKGAAAEKVIKPLLASGLVQEVPSTPETPAWRRDEAEGQSYALVITREGRSAINAEDEGEQGAPAEPPKSAS